MTLLSIGGFQPRKRKQIIAPICIDCSDISIILPVKNNQKGITLFLSEFLKTHPSAMYPKEVVIVDNNSQPPITIPQDVIESDLNTTVLLCSSPGPACARNLGIQHVCSQWVLFTDSDCIPSSTFLLGYIAAMDGSIGYAGKVKAWGKDRLSRYYESQEILTPPSVYDSEDERPAYLVTANTLVWKTALKDIGGFNETISIAAGEDIDLGFRLREIGTLSFASSACVYHNFSDGLVGFIKRFLRYGKGNRIVSRLHALDLTPRNFEAKKPSVFNKVLSRIQYLCLFWGYRTG